MGIPSIQMCKFNQSEENFFSWFVVVSQSKQISVFFYGLEEIKIKGVSNQKQSLIVNSNHKKDLLCYDGVINKKKIFHYKT